MRYNRRTDEHALKVAGRLVPEAALLWCATIDAPMNMPCNNPLKYAVVIADGASGEPLDAYGGQTSLEVAHTPHLDALAQTGLVGLSKNVPDNLEPSSNIACTAICGYDPALYPIGRGALEGAALGLELADDEVALRLNLTHVSPEGVMVSYSTDNISGTDARALLTELAAALDDDTFKLYPGVGFRGILVVKGHPGLLQTRLYAAHNMSDEKVAGYQPHGPEAALIINYQNRARRLLASSPTNTARRNKGLLPATDVFVFWPGQRPQHMTSFAKLYGKNAGMLSGVDLLNGIALLANIQPYHFAGVTDGPDNNYTAQAEGALQILAEKDVAFIHVEAPDAEGHDGNAAGKIAAIEALDREIISRLVPLVSSLAARVLVLPDHPTPVALKRHSRDLVPFVLAGSGFASNGGRRLTEAEGARTGLIVSPGYQLMAMLLSAESACSPAH
ncbi:MAG: 2,3-bisphosphoglycerate-independent phosphoglycerate mutase [Coriobacteriales bacterium]|jgi:2,3-bisphosphoglycerate-independent phosphoglycerate mutase|nr:2,3-bisphosphoglycerate-independent phosphoglycerate mutase [Coriobacteriales bacterium]